MLPAVKATSAKKSLMDNRTTKIVIRIPFANKNKNALFWIV